MKSPIRAFIVFFLCLANVSWAGTKSAIVTSTPVVINLRANQVLNVHQYYFIYPSEGASIGLAIQIGSETFGGLVAKQVNAVAYRFDALVWPERPFKVAGPAVVTVPAADSFKSFITYSIDPR